MTQDDKGELFDYVRDKAQESGKRDVLEAELKTIQQFEYLKTQREIESIENPNDIGFLVMAYFLWPFFIFFKKPRQRTIYIIDKYTKPLNFRRGLLYFCLMIFLCPYLIAEYIFKKRGGKIS